MVFAGVSSGEIIMEMSKIVNESFPGLSDTCMSGRFATLRLHLTGSAGKAGMLQPIRERAEQWVVWRSFFRCW